MESYYSSDEEVCWGPVSTREIKKSLNRPRKAVPRRRTIRMNSPPKPKHQQHKEDILSLVEHVSSLSVESKYYTPNETMHKSPTTNFEEKASQILNNTEPEATFITAIDTSIDHSGATVLPESKKEMDDEIPGSANITCIGDNVQDSCLINNFQITLANSYSSDDENFSNNIDDIIETLNNDLESSNSADISKKSSYVNNTSINEKNDQNESKSTDNKTTILYNSVIVISDGEDEVDDDLSPCVINESMRYQGTQSQYEDISEVFQDTISTGEESENEENEVENYSLTSLGKFKINEVKNNQIKLEDNTVVNEVENNPPIIKSIDNEMDHQSKSSDFGLDDTLEEINRALEMGLDYSMSESITSQIEDNSNAKLKISERENSRKEQCTGSYSLELDYSLSESITSQISELKIRKCESPKNKQDTPTFNCSQILRSKNILSEIKPQNVLKTSPDNYSKKSYTQFNKEGVSEFKQPLRPIKSPMPKYQQNSLCFKNIKSPVAVYIKNCPSAPLQQNVQTAVKPSRLPIKSSLTPQKISKISLPSVAYKPAHNAILSKQREIKLPGSIEKFIPMKSTIIKHEGRIAKSNTKDCVNRKLMMDSDLTVSSIDASLLGASTQDVSILTSKKAFIE